MSQHYDKPNTGTVFKPETGKLYVFRPNRIAVMLAWPKPMAWRKTSTNPSWSHFRPEISIPCRNIGQRIDKLETLNEKSERLSYSASVFRRRMKRRAELAWLRWYETIPTDVRYIVRRFPSRQWHILSLVARCDSPALDLVVANPALAYALASNWVFHNPPVQRPMRSARALLRRGRTQRDILAWLGFPGTEAVRRVLTKVADESISVDGLLYLRQSLVDSKMAKTLSHLQRLNAGAIRIVTDRKLFPYASPTLIEEISNRREEDNWAMSAHELQDSLNMYRVVSPNGKKLQPIRRLAHLRELHDSLIDKLNNSRRSNFDIPLPPPPVEGTETIVPITSIQDLFKEGREQHNCVASYIERIAIQQRTYIYKVLGPERCTLALTQKDKIWVPTEIKKDCNQPVSEVTWSAVGRWLNQASSSVGNNEVPELEAKV